MSLADDLAKPVGSGCSYSEALAQLSTEEHDLVVGAVVDPSWSPSALSGVLAENRIVVSQQSIARHRKQDGRCSKCL